MEQNFTQWWEANLKDITADGPMYTIAEVKWWAGAAMKCRAPSQSGLPLPPESSEEGSQSPPGDLLAVEMEAILKQMETVPWAVSTITIRDWAKGIRDALAPPPPVSLPEGLDAEIGYLRDLAARMFDDSQTYWAGKVSDAADRIIAAIQAPAPLGEAPKPEAPSWRGQQFKCEGCETETDIISPYCEKCERAYHAERNAAAAPEPSPVVEPAPLALEILQAEFNELAEYSCSIPSGATIGKRWKRKKDYHDVSKGWVVGEYTLCDEPGMVGIKWREVKIIGEAPAPLVKGGVVETGKGGQS